MMLSWTAIFAIVLTAGESKPWERAEWGDFPFLVSYDVRGFNMECLGTIIGKRWILTTASCIIDPKNVTQDIIITAGRVNNYTNHGSIVRTKVNVSGLFSHEKFNPTTFENDIGLIKLNEDLQFNRFLRPISPDESGDLRNASYYVVGWGDLGKEFLGFTGIKYSTVPVSDSNTCKSYIGNFNCSTQSYYDKKRENIICSIGDRQPIYTLGYSHLFGGPLVTRKSKDEFVLAGITSWASYLGSYSESEKSCTVQSSVLVYTDITLYLDWVRIIMEAGSNLY